MEFTCEKCGACCRMVGCPLLTEDMLCSIYDMRPNACRYGWSYERLELHKVMTKDRFAEMSKKLCEHFRKLLGD